MTSHHTWKTVQILALANKKGTTLLLCLQLLQLPPHPLHSIPWPSSGPSNMPSSFPPEVSRRAIPSAWNASPLSQSMGSRPLSFEFQFECPLLQQAFLGTWSKLRHSSLVTLCFHFFMALIATSNYLGFQVRFPRSRAKDRFLSNWLTYWGNALGGSLQGSKGGRIGWGETLSKDVV